MQRSPALSAADLDATGSSSTMASGHAARARAAVSSVQPLHTTTTSTSPGTRTGEERVETTLDHRRLVVRRDDHRDRRTAHPVIVSTGAQLRSRGSRARPAGEPGIDRSSSSNGPSATSLPCSRYRRRSQRRTVLSRCAIVTIVSLPAEALEHLGELELGLVVERRGRFVEHRGCADRGRARARNTETLALAA